ncbi:MAG: YjfB family protein [Burkholderiaceae bacterium]
MEINGIANLASSLSQTTSNDEVGYAVLRKALNAASSTAVQLIDALPAVQPAANLPAHLGQNINTVA